MTGSALWGAPVAPDRWFEAERLERSRSYHRPLARAGSIRLLLQAIGVATAWWVLRALLASDGAASAWPMLVSGALVAAALWVPQLLVDAWIEYRHESQYHRPSVPARSFVALSLLSLALVVAVGAVVALLVQRVSAWAWWPVIVWLVLTCVMTRIGPASARWSNRATPLDPETAATLAVVAAAGGVSQVAWGRLVGGDEAGVNAVTIGGVGHPQVLCSDALLATEPDLRDFVVAHEIGHLAGRHHHKALVASLLGVAVEVAGVWAADRLALSRMGGGLSDPRNWPLVVTAASLAAVPTVAAESWLSRVHERQADLAAVATVGPLGASVLRVLHDHDRSELDPGRLRRVFARHPAPAERLAAAERSMRSERRLPAVPPR